MKISRFIVGPSLVIATICATEVYDNMADRSRFINICATSAGTYLLDTTAGTITKRERLVCDAGKPDKKCKSVGVINDHLKNKGLTALGFKLDRRKVDAKFGVDYRVFDLGAGKFILSQDFSGPEPGFKGLVGDLIPAGDFSDLSCYDI